MKSAEAHNESFFRLSPDRVLEAVEAGGFRPTGHCFALNALENRVYDIRLEDGSQPGAVEHLVAKFYRPGRWTREAILDEHEMLFALQANEIPVCAPLRFSNGESVHEIDGIYYAVWPRTGGRAPDEFRDDQLRVLGHLLARIHNEGEALHLEHRRTLTSEAIVDDALDILEDGDFLPPQFAGRYREAALEAAGIYDDLSDGVKLQPIHGDCHPGNLLLGDAGWFFLDFDDMVIGPAVQDVWMLLPGRDVYAEQQREQLIEAYREFRAFDPHEFELIEPLRAFRFVFYAGWIAKRWNDPCFPDAFPHFGTDEYWENETRDLEEQVERIRSGESAGADAGTDGEARAGEEAEGGLTNEDFFWDL